jgi:MFS family permease
LKLSRVVILLSLVSLFADIASELLYPVMPVYLRTAGYSFVAIGLLEGLANVFAGFSKGYFGKISDKSGSRIPFVRYGYGFSAIAKGLLLISASLPVIYLSRLTDRVGKGIRTAPRDALLASESTPETRASIFGFHRAMDTLGAAIGPVVALIWLWFHPGDYKTMFLFAVIPAVISWLITLFIRAGESKSSSRTSKGSTGFFSYFNYWKTASSSYKTLVGSLIFFALLNSPDVFLLLAVKAAGWSDQYMIGGYIFYNLLYALLSFPVGRIADAYGRMNVLLTGIILFVITYAGMAINTTMEGFILLFAVYAASMACTESVVKAIISGMSTEHERGTAIGFYGSTNSLGALLAGLWTGWVFGAWGIAPAFVITAGGAILVFIYILVMKNKPVIEN